MIAAVSCLIFNSLLRFLGLAEANGIEGSKLTVFTFHDFFLDTVWLHPCQPYLSRTMSLVPHRVNHPCDWLPIAAIPVCHMT